MKKHSAIIVYLPSNAGTKYPSIARIPLTASNAPNTIKITLNKHSLNYS